MLDKKIVFVRTHENVNFEKTYQNHFSTEKRPGRSQVQINLIPELQCVQIHNDQDSVVVPLVNIAFLKLEGKLIIDSRKAAAEEAAKPKSTIKSHQIKKPK